MEYFTNDFETDCMILYNYVDNLKLHRVNNRANINGGIKPLSNIYGTTKWGYVKTKNSIVHKEPCPEGGFYTKLRTENPEYEEIFREFTNLYIPDFSYNQIVINKNFEVKPHKDASNVGVSYIIGLGEYEGGELVIDKETCRREVNIKNKFYSFNGSEITHWVKPFSGDRYSLVFYNSEV